MKKIFTPLAGIFILAGIASCDDFVKIDAPRTALVRSTVFESDATAKAAITDMYYQMRISGFASGAPSSISFYTSLACDEEISYFQSIPSVTAEYQQLNDNNLKQNNSQLFQLWSDLYKSIYKANSILEGLAASTQVSEPLKAQLKGEAKFIRAFCHFYLVNLWGDVPLLLTTDYRSNSVAGRTASQDVYKQIIADLTDAKSLLANDYSFSNNERVRASRGSATALLSRAYLYTGDWVNAEAQATIVIADPQYTLASSLSDVFMANGKESLLQLWSDNLPMDRSTFNVLTIGPVYGALRPQFVSAFEAGDQRWTIWGRTRVVSGVTYYYAFKYSSAVISPPAQYSTVLRIAEQYLIRAEARAQQNNVSGAQADTNIIRNRAGLTNTPANDKASLLLAIEQERRSEFMNEWGHRWFDLKRTNRATAVLTPLKTQWTTTAVLFPLPESEMINNAALRNAQNPGY